MQSEKIFNWKKRCCGIIRHIVSIGWPSGTLLLIKAADNNGYISNTVWWIAGGLLFVNFVLMYWIRSKFRHISFERDKK